MEIKCFSPNLHHSPFHSRACHPQKPPQAADDERRLKAKAGESDKELDKVKHFISRAVVLYAQHRVRSGFGEVK